MTVEEVLGDVGKGNLTRRVDVLGDECEELQTHLAGDGYLPVFLEANWAFRAIRVVEHDGDAGFGDAGLATFVDQVLLICSAHLWRKTRRLKGIFGEWVGWAPGPCL